MLSGDGGGKPETSHGVVSYHKVTLRKKHRRNHSQGASGENHRRNQRACNEKNEVKQQEYEDSEKNNEDLEQ